MGHVLWLLRWPPARADSRSVWWSPGARAVPKRDFAPGSEADRCSGRYLRGVQRSIPPWCAAVFAGLLSLSTSGAAALAQGADVCANAVQAGVGSVQVPYDTFVCTDTGSPATTQVLAFQPCAIIGADVWFRWTASRTGPTRFALCGSSFDCKLGLWLGSVCGGLVPLDCDDDTCSLQSELVLATTLGQEYFVQIGYFDSGYPPGTHVWGNGTLAIDELSPVVNDTCATPVVFPLGVSALPFDTGSATPSGFSGGGGCFVHPWPDVFFEWRASTSGNYEFRTCGASGDTVVAVHRGTGCGAICEVWNDDRCGLQSVAQVIGVNAGATFLVQVAGYQGARPSGLLEVAMFSPPACALGDDTWEENDDCVQAMLLGDGLYPDLVCREDDNDFYSVVVPPGQELIVVLLFDDALADLDLYLWSEAGTLLQCGTEEAGPGSNNGSLAAALSTTNNEVLTYVNHSTAPERILVEVDVYSGGTQTCTVYDLTVTGTGPTPVGVSFCDALPNSSGAPGVLYVTQAPVSQDPTLTINVVPLPLNSFGFLLMSRGTFGGAVISGGMLCLQPATLLRFQLGLVNSGGFGASSFPFPWQIAPATIQSGETWHFQFWHRDLVGGVAGANFSRGLSLLFS